MKIQLANGCARSEISVTPKNWDTDPLSIKEKDRANLLEKEWQVYYRYYDPAFEKDPKLWAKKFPIRAGLNEIKDLSQRQVAARALIEGERDKLDNQLYNPITGKYHITPDDVQEITPNMPFIQALKEAKKLLKAGKECVQDIGYAINAMEAGATKIYDKTYQKPYIALPISVINSKHLEYTLVQCRKNNPEMTAYRYNRFRTYLIMLFKVLKRVHAATSNPALELEIDYTWVKTKREILTDEEALIIDINLKAWDYYYWRFMRIFFRSSSRETEMLALQRENVDIDLQEFKILVKKGKQYKWETRPIPDDALRFWREVIQEAQTGEYLFSVGFKPGNRKIGKDNVSNRWRKYVKDDPPPVPAEPPKDKRKLSKRKFVPLGIKKDFYSLKHKNLDLIEKELGRKAAQKAAGHTSDSTTAIYTVGAEQRRRDELKTISIDFSPLLPEKN